MSKSHFSKAILPLIAMSAMMGASMEPYSEHSHHSRPSKPSQPREYSTPRQYTDEERIARKLHKKKIKARKNARRRKARR